MSKPIQESGLQTAASWTPPVDAPPSAVGKASSSPTAEASRGSLKYRPGAKIPESLGRAATDKRAAAAQNPATGAATLGLALEVKLEPSVTFVSGPGSTGRGTNGVGVQLKTTVTKTIYKTPTEEATVFGSVTPFAFEGKANGAPVEGVGATFRLGGGYSKNWVATTRSSFRSRPAPRRFREALVRATHSNSTSPPRRA